MAFLNLDRNSRKNLKPLNPFAESFLPPTRPPPPPAVMGWTAALGRYCYYPHNFIQYIPSYEQSVHYNALAQPQLDYKKSSSLVYNGGRAVTGVTDRGEKLVKKVGDSERGTTSGGVKIKVVGSDQKIRRMCLQRRSCLSDKKEHKCKLTWMPSNTNNERLIQGKTTLCLSDKKENKCKLTWMPSNTNNERLIQGKTTLMIRNIPNKMRREDLVGILDEHCRQENQKTILGCDPSPSEFDFVYLPMDFNFHLNLGYAFVNFTTKNAALKLCKFLSGWKWKGFSTNKTCQIGSARIQGKQALLRQFKNSNFICHTDDYMPVVFEPPRNGVNSFTPPSVIGKFVPPPSSINA